MAGRVSFEEQNVKATPGQVDYPKFKLAKNGDCGRLLVIEDPLVAYIHDLKRPKIVNGQPQTKVEERRDGSTYTDYVMDFISRPLCLGDEGILAERGVDPDHCPACKLSVESDMVAAPKRRFAMNVIQYMTRPGTTDVALPYQVNCVVWSFTDTIFTKLVSFKKENGDLRQHDLLLGPCTNPTFQKFDIAVSTKAEWLQYEPGEEALAQAGQPGRRQQLTAQVYEHNKFDDLEAACGRMVKAEWMLTDLQKVREGWMVANGQGAQPAPGVMLGTSGFDQGQLRQGLDGLLAGQQGGQPQQPQYQQPQQNFQQQPMTQGYQGQQPQFQQPDPQQQYQQPQVQQQAPVGDQFAALAGGPANPQPQQPIQQGDPSGLLSMQPQQQAPAQQQAAPAFNFGQAQPQQPQQQAPAQQSQLPQPQDQQVSTPSVDQLAQQGQPQQQAPVQQQVDPLAQAGQGQPQPQAQTGFDALLAGIPSTQPQV